ncbi:deacylase, partial [Burkholderia sp. SIMBA_051]
EQLAQQPEVYFEAGDHEALIHMTQDEFLALMETAERAHFSHKMLGMWVS